MNANEISGFDAMAEEIREVYAERDQYKAILDEIKKIFKMGSVWTYGEIPGFVKAAHEFALEKKECAEEQFKQFAEDICSALGARPDMSTIESIISEVSKLRREHDTIKYTVKKQEDFTEEAADILGVHPGDLSLSDVLEALRKLKREEKLDEMNSEIIADLRTERDNLQRYISNTLSKICSALGIEYSTDTTLEYILDTIDDLKARSLEFNLRTENFRHLCDILGLEPKDTKWTDIFNEVESLRAKYLNLCGDFACCCNKLGLDCTECNRNSVMAKIDELRSKEDTYCHQSFVFNSVCDYLGIAADDATISDIRAEIEKLKSWKTVAADHDKRRRNWVRKYKSEHERANSCNELYKKYKALYDADAPRRKKLSDDLETYRSSYEAVKSQAVKNRSLMNTVAQIVGTVGMHDDVTLTGVLNARKKANHWDILVDGYGEGTIRSLLDNIGIDVSGDKGNGLFK